MFIAEINSTNDYLHQHPELDYVRTDYQTAGRGQAGNGWESERGQNLLCSVRLANLNLPVQRQWQINQLVALALHKTVASYLPSDAKLTIKWPNDLYYGNRKLAGILIENTLCSNQIADSIVGIGLNLNQTQWHSDAPNPISLTQITGQQYDTQSVMQAFLSELASTDWRPTVNDLYRARLYRCHGWYWWEEREVSTAPTTNGTRSAQSFEAEIADLTEQGELVLRTRDNILKTYHFKQIKYIL